MRLMNSENVANIMMRALDYVDPRLIDHGVRTGYCVLRMMEADGGYDKGTVRDMCIMSILHDIGAYKTEEISNMVQFETGDVWEHSVYGYLFIKNLSPMPEYAPVILLHHLEHPRLKGVDCSDETKKKAQILSLADRADVYRQMGKQQPVEEYLKKYVGTKFSKEVYDLFLKQQKQERNENGGKDGQERECYLDRVLGAIREQPFSDEQIEGFLKMLIFSIDFRSEHTVIHTITTTAISVEAARRLNAGERLTEKIRHGALLHDLGKIGIPVEILEFPGKLSPQAMNYMRTHVDLTEKILDGQVDDEVTQIALRHHEKLDGSGYPKGWKEADLSLAQRIVAVSDIVSALTGTRSYKEAYDKERTLSILQRMKCEGLICPYTVDVLTESFDVIMEEVKRQCRPILDIYTGMKTEYNDIIEVCRNL